MLIVARVEEYAEEDASSRHAVCEYLTPRELAVMLNLSTDMVYSLLREGELPAIRLGTGKRQVWRIPNDDFRRYLDTIRSGPKFE
jgi:excisionase family DNA binding protein